MSTSPRPEEPRPHLEMAAHLGSQLLAAKDACVSAVQTERAICYVAHYTSGVFDLGVDSFGDSPAPPVIARRDELKRLGRQLSSAATHIARLLQDMRTGRLLRTTLRTKDGAVFCDSVLPSRIIVAIVSDQPILRTTSPMRRSPAEIRRAAANAVTDLTKRLRERTELTPSSEHLPSPVVVPPGLMPQPKVTVFARRPANKLVDACKTAVRLDGLQLVACWSHGGLTTMVDQLDHPSFAAQFEHTSVETRRRHYQGLSELLGALASRLNRTTAAAPMCGRLDSMTFNVELGAIYCHRFGPGDYVVGVTVDKKNVNSAQELMLALTAKVADA